MSATSSTDCTLFKSSDSESPPFGSAFGFSSAFALAAAAFLAWYALFFSGSPCLVDGSGSCPIGTSPGSPIGFGSSPPSLEKSDLPDSFPASSSPLSLPFAFSTSFLASA